MNYKKLAYYGVLIWAVVYLVATAFVGYKIMDNIVAKIVLLIIVALVSFFAGKALKETSIKKILIYSVGWFVIALVLDIALTVPFTGWGVFKSWDWWVGYLIIILIPMLAKQKTAVTQ